MISPKDVERFWAKVNKEGSVPEHCPEIGPCWTWTGATSGIPKAWFAATLITSAFVQNW